jgi:hypothetical protein
MQIHGPFNLRWSQRQPSQPPLLLQSSTQIPVKSAVSCNECGDRKIPSPVSNGVSLFYGFMHSLWPDRSETILRSG